RCHTFHYVTSHSKSRARTISVWCVTRLDSHARIASTHCRSLEPATGSPQLTQAVPRTPPPPHAAQLAERARTARNRRQAETHPHFSFADCRFVGSSQSGCTG